MFKFVSDLKKLQDEKKREETPEFDPEWLKDQAKKEQREEEEKKTQLLRTASTSSMNLRKSSLGESNKKHHLLTDEELDNLDTLPRAELPTLPSFSLYEDFLMFHK